VTRYRCFDGRSFERQGLHDLTDRIVLHLSEQMDVVGHQAVSVEIEGTLRFLVLEREQKLKIVIVRSEYAPAIILASDDVVEPTAYFNSRLRAMATVGSLLFAGMSIFHA